MNQKYCEDCGGKKECSYYQCLTSHTYLSYCPFKSLDAGRVRKKQGDFEKEVDGDK